MSSTLTLGPRRQAPRRQSTARKGASKPKSKTISGRGRGVGFVFFVAIAGIVLVAGLFLAVFPLTTLLEQRNEMSETEAQLGRLRGQTQLLETRAEALQSDQEIERLARAQYNLVRPGEEAIALLPEPEGAATTTTLPDPLPTDPDSRPILERAVDAATFWTP